MHSIGKMLLLVSTVFLLFFPESTAVFQISIFIGTIVAFDMFYRLMKFQDCQTIGNIYCLSILFGYIVSTFFYVIINLFQTGKINYIYTDLGIYYSQLDLSQVTIILYLIAIILSAIASLEEPLNLSDFIASSLSKRTLLIVAFSCILILAAFVRGDLGYMGIYLIDERRISLIGAICFLMIPALTSISFAWLISYSSQDKKYRNVLLVICSILALTLVPLGRRVLMYSIMLSLIFAGPKLFAHIREKKINLVFLFFILIIVIIAILTGFQAFYAMRILIGQMALDQPPKLMQVIPFFLDTMKDSYFRADVYAMSSINLSERPYILSYLAAIWSAHKVYTTPILGEFWHALSMAVPSIFFPEKSTLLLPAAEDFIHPALNIPIFDGPNTIVTAGLNDFGLIGMFIYPVWIIFIYMLIAKFARKYTHPFLYLFIVARLMYALLYIEEGIGALVGSGLRDLALIALIYLIMLKRMRTSFTPAGAKGYYE